MNIKKFTIFGERNSGTTYLKNLLKQKLDLNFTEEYGFNTGERFSKPYETKKTWLSGIPPRG